MNQATAERIPEQLIEQAKAVSLLSLAERHAELRKISSAEWAGPCPRCGGEKRFHVHDRSNWFFCRDCHAKRGDSIEFVRWLSGLTFAEAVQQLTGALPAAPAAVRRAPEPKVASSTEQAATWRPRAERLVAEAHERLWRDESKAAHDYLDGRGIAGGAWLTFRLGYDPSVALPGTEGKQRAPAIVLPWFDAKGAVVAVRYRFLQVHTYQDADGAEHTAKQTALSGSQFGERLFGVAGLLRAGEAHRTLVLCEGEINAMSIWQQQHDAELDVLSIGSESQHLTPAMVGYLQTYKRLIVWADKGSIAQQLMAALPGAYGIKSPGGNDANDLLQKGLLGGFLATVRHDAARDTLEREALLWALWDCARLPAGIDSGTAQVLQRIAGGLGKQAPIEQIASDSWIAVTE